ncbi:hypothetical protein BJX96DRAFT_141869 [Aspergillus floccosus]
MTISDHPVSPFPSRLLVWPRYAGWKTGKTAKSLPRFLLPLPLFWGWFPAPLSQLPALNGWCDGAPGVAGSNFPAPVAFEKSSGDPISRFGWGRGGRSWFRVS